MNGELSLYIHVPFCLHKCGYCHFFVLPFQNALVEKYLAALEKECALWQPLKPPLTIYFGGGTPALLSPAQLAKILSWIPHSKETEITLEANPETLTLPLLKDFISIGINRISLGVQSLDDSLLGTLDRRHSSKKALSAIDEAAKAGFKNISIDLMVDIPTQTPASWRRTLDQLSRLPLTHLSLYNLTFEPHTAFYKHRERLKKMVPDEEKSVAMLEEALLYLPSIGLQRYEISAFAKQNYASIHNSGYWTGRPFLGWGPSAFSYVEGKRRRNVANLNTYSRKVHAGELASDFEEELAPLPRMKELLALHLRLVAGVSLQRFSLPEETYASLHHLREQGLVSFEGEVVRLTERGTLFYDTVASELIEI